MATTAEGSPASDSARVGIRRGIVGAVRCVLLPVPPHRRGGVVVAHPVLPVRLGVEVVVDHRIEQRLTEHRRSAPVAGGDRDGHGEVSTGTVAGKHDARRVSPVRRDGRGRPFERGVQVVVRGRGRVFGGEAVIDGHDDGPDSLRHRPAELVVTVEIAEDEPSTVREHDDRARGLGGLGTVEAQREAASRSVDDEIVYLTGRVSASGTGRAPRARPSAHS